MSRHWVRPGDVPRDPGLQPERTVLAWRRTWLAALVTLLLVVRAVLLRTGAVGGTGAPNTATAAVAWAALGVAVVGALLLAVAAFLPGRDVGTLATAAGAVLLIAAATAAVGVDLASG